MELKQNVDVPQDTRWELAGYTHDRELGAGAAGRVVLAWHDATGRPVAIKYLNGELATRSGLQAEAELLGALDSPHVTRLYEYVESSHGAAIVMEPVNGVSLRDLLQAEGATQPEAALSVLKGSLLGLAAAHEAGLVHRDYKPGNVLVTPDGMSKLIDFGIAVPVGNTGDIVGTPAYMAPEQWEGKPASPTTDVYAATATFFECLTGAKPFDGTTLSELATQHMSAAVPAESVPLALRPLLRAGLAKTPQQRPGCALDLVVELEAAAGAEYGDDWEKRGRGMLAAVVVPLLLSLGHPSLALRSMATTDLGGSGGPHTSDGPGMPNRRRRVKGRKAIGSAAAGAVLIGALAVVATTGTGGSDGNTAIPAPKLTSSLGPLPGESPIASLLPAPPSESISPTASDSAPVSASGSAETSTASVPVPVVTQTISASAPKPASSATVPPRGTTAPSPSPSTSRASLRVLAISMTVSCDGESAAKAAGTVFTNGTKAGTLTMTWSWTGATGGRISTSRILTLPTGQKTVPFSFSQPFNGAGALTARAASTPAAERGQNISGDVTYSTCDQPS
ncbi:protein kinase [Streptomyces sp. NPDC053431]|uniref:protein kinase domain-containing protein n=1 Tax=Streptomyces sp. NPDC053431 TaxID=3365703 RepID=UPI0037D39B9E